MAVMKRIRAQEAMRSAVALDLEDLAREAEAIVAKARADARKIIEQASEEAMMASAATKAAARTEGHDAGHAAGLAEGRAEGRAEAIAEFRPRLDEICNAWSEQVTAWESERLSMIMRASQEVLHFGLDLAERIVHRVIEHDEGVAADQVLSALAIVTQGMSVEVAINPEDRKIVEAVMATIVERIGSTEHAALRDDERIGRGGCIVRTAGGEIDATVETQLDRIAAALIPASGDS
ncbi:MAG: FliH/SctL family protein [Planctomycetota bacterium]|jgi:flagellar biosynthesis/type III secretory pathway protein FliH